MTRAGETRSPRWNWRAGSGAQLSGRDGTQYLKVGPLSREEIERLLTLKELDAVRVECGGGVVEWVGPEDARRLWLSVEQDLDDVEGWRPPQGARGALPYCAELWRAASGHHVILFTDE